MRTYPQKPSYTGQPKGGSILDANPGSILSAKQGLDREAAMQAFSEFITGTTTSPNQIEFINLIVQELTQNGVMVPDRLFQFPFTVLNAKVYWEYFPRPRLLRLLKSWRRSGSMRHA